MFSMPSPSKLGSVLGLWLMLFMFVSCQRSHTRSSGVCISFDDRSIIEWHALMPLFKKYNASVTFFVTQFDSLTDREIQLLHEIETAGHEIGSHGAQHVFAGEYIRSHGYDRYLQDEVDQSISSMQAAGFDPQNFAYPHGSGFFLTDYLLLKRFRIIRTITLPQGEKDITALDEIFYEWDGHGTTSALSIDNGIAVTEEQVRAAILHAKREKKVLMLYGHVPGDSMNIYEFDISYLEFILKTASHEGLSFLTFRDLQQP